MERAVYFPAFIPSCNEAIVASSSSNGPGPESGASFPAACCGSGIREPEHPDNPSVPATNVDSMNFLRSITSSSYAMLRKLCPGQQRCDYRIGPNCLDSYIYCSIY